MGYRREERLPLHVPALVSGLDKSGRAFIQQAKTLDISSVGARITGLTCQINPGTILSIQLGDRKSRFQVTWVGKPGTAQEGEIGLRCIEVGTHKSRRVLYVEDQDHEVESRKGYLEAAGYDVLAARSGREALNILQGYSFDSVVLDYPLYDMDCGEIVRYIKSNTPQTRVVILSVYPGRIPEPMLALADAFVHKGQPRQKLLKLLDEMIGSTTRIKWPLTRTNSRFAIRVPVVVKVMRSGSLVVIEGRSTDLNEQGLGAVLDQEMSPGELVALEFKLPMSDELFTPRATVRRRTGANYGFEFVHIDPEQQKAIRNFCEVLPPLDVPQPV